MTAPTQTPSSSDSNDIHDANTYFMNHPELFTEKTDIAKTAILVIITLIVAVIAYLLWFNPELIFASEEARRAGKYNLIMTIIKWGSTIALPILLLMVFGGGVKKYYDKQSGGAIEKEFLEKHISSEHTEVREWFINGEFDKILALPVVSWYYNKDVTVFTLSHNPDGKKFYAFCNYMHHNEEGHGKLISNVQTEQLPVMHIGEPTYSQIMPMVQANIKAVKEVKDAEGKEKNIVVTPNI